MQKSVTAFAKLKKICELKMKINSENDSAKKLEQAFEQRSKGIFIFQLYCSGLTPRSLRAIENIKKLCEEHLKGHYELTVIDILQQPDRIKKNQIITSPTLVKLLPLPIRKFVGDLSNIEKILLRLDLKEQEQ